MAFLWAVSRGFDNACRRSLLEQLHLLDAISTVFCVILTISLLFWSCKSFLDVRTLCPHGEDPTLFSPNPDEVTLYVNLWFVGFFESLFLKRCLDGLWQSCTLGIFLDRISTLSRRVESIHFGYLWFFYWLHLTQISSKKWIMGRWSLVRCCVGKPCPLELSTERRPRPLESTAWCLFHWKGHLYAKKPSNEDFQRNK